MLSGKCSFDVNTSGKFTAYNSRCDEINYLWESRSFGLGTSIKCSKAALGNSLPFCALIRDFFVQRVIKCEFVKLLEGVRGEEEFDDF